VNSFDDELKSHLAGSAASITAEPVGVAEVERRGRRRGHRRRAVAVAAVVALVAAAVVGIRPLVTDGDSILDIAAGTAATTTIAPRSQDAAAVGNSAPSQSPLSVTTTTFLASESAVHGYRYPGYDGWVVPWGDGFLSVTTLWEPAPALEIGPEILDRFPPEMAAVIEAAGASNLEEMGNALTAAGLEQQAGTVVRNDPGLLDMLDSLAGGPGTATLVAQESTDGSTWTDVAGFSPPVAVGSISQVISDGTHLIIARQSWGRVPPSDGAGPQAAPDTSGLSVLVTSNLTDWQSYDVATAMVDGPSYLRSEQWMSGLAIGPDGWLATVLSSSSIDIRSLLPVDVQQFQGGVDYRETPDGIEVEFYPDTEPSVRVYPAEGTATAPEIPTTTSASGESPAPARTRFFSWADLGVDPGEYARLQSARRGGTVDTTTWVGTWDGVVRSSTEAGGSPYPGEQVVGTDAGFLAARGSAGSGAPELVFSPDGLTWTAAEPLPGGRFGSIIAVEGGVLIDVTDQGRRTMWRGSPEGTGWTEVDIPGVDTGQIHGSQASGPGFVSVIDVTRYADSTPPPVEFDAVIEQDGQSIHLHAHDDGTADLVITDLVTGDIVAELSGAFNGLTADFAEVGQDSVVIVDGAGNEVVSIPLQVVADTVLPAREKAIEASGWEPPAPRSGPPELVIVASADGVQWLVAPVDRAGGSATYEEYPSAMGINGGTVVVRMGGAWRTYRIA